MVRKLIASVLAASCVFGCQAEGGTEGQSLPPAELAKKRDAIVTGGGGPSTAAADQPINGGPGGAVGAPGQR